MNTTTIIRLLLFAVMLLTLSGCVNPFVDYAVRNCTGRELNNVNITIGDDYEFSMGVLIIDAHKGYGGPVPLKQKNEVNLEWENPEGKKASAKLVVTKIQMKDPRQLFFDIQKDNTVTFSWRFEDEKR